MECIVVENMWINRNAWFECLHENIPVRRVSVNCLQLGKKFCLLAAVRGEKICWKEIKKKTWKNIQTIIKFSTYPLTALGCWLSATKERPIGGNVCLKIRHELSTQKNESEELGSLRYLPSLLVQARHCPHCCYCSSPPRPPAERRCCCSPSVFPWQTAPAPWRDQAPRKMPCVTRLWFELLVQYYFLGCKIQICLSAVLSMTLRHTYEIWGLFHW